MRGTSAVSRIVIRMCSSSDRLTAINTVSCEQQSQLDTRRSTAVTRLLKGCIEATVIPWLPCLASYLISKIIISIAHIQQREPSATV